MAFPPRSFRKKAPQIGLKRTSAPTGMLANPTDLISQPRPWISVEESPSTEDFQNKTLIFADHLFAKRNLKQKQEIIYRLNALKNQGFKVFFKIPDGGIEPWNGKIPVGYQLNLQTDTTEYLHQLAWEQGQLSSENIAILDQWGINELLEQPRNTLEWEMFQGGENASFIELVNSSAETGFNLKFRRHPSIDPIDNFLEFFTDRAEQLPVHKFKQFDMTEGRVTRDHLRILFEKIPWVESLRIRDRLHEEDLGIAGLAGFARDLDKGQLSQLKEFYFRGVAQWSKDITIDDAYNLLQACPALEKLTLDIPEDLDFFMELRETKSQNLKELHLYGGPPRKPDKREDPDSLAEAERNRFRDMLIILYASRHADILDIPLKNMSGIDWQALTHKLRDFVPDLLPKLQQLSLYEISFHPLVLQSLSELAPVARLHLHRPIISGFANAMSKPNLSNLRAISFRKDTAPEQMLAVIKATPFLETLEFEAGTSIDFLTQFKPDELKYLKKINLNHCKLKPEQVLALLKAAPQLEEIYLEGIKYESLGDSLNALNLQHLRVIHTGLQFSFAVKFKKGFKWLEEATDNASVIEIIEIKLKNQLEGLNQVYKDKFITFLEDISRAAPHVKELQVTFPDFSNGGRTHPKAYDRVFLRFSRLKGCFPDLTHLNVTGEATPLRCALTAESFHKFIATFPRLERIKFPDDAVISIEGAYFFSSPEKQKYISMGFPHDTFYKPLVLEEGHSARIAPVLPSTAPMRTTEPSATSLKPSPPDQPVKTPARPGTVPAVFTSDALDTRFKAGKILGYTEYFPGVKDPSRYRLRLWKPQLDSLKGPEEFKPTDFKKVRQKTISKEDRYFSYSELGQKDVLSTDGTEILLPSLDAEEQFFNLSVTTPDGKKIPVDLMHSPSTGFHLVKLPYAGNFHIDFRVIPPAPELPTKRPKMPGFLVKLFNEYQRYGIDSSDNEPPKVNTLKEFAENIRNRNPPVGSCLHRSIAAYDLCESNDKYKGKSYIVLNDVHAFLEVRKKKRFTLKERVYPVDLGGYPAHLEKLTTKAEEKMEEKKVEPTVTPSKPSEKAAPLAPKVTAAPPPLLFPMREASTDELLTNVSTPCLIQVNSDAALQAWYTRLLQQQATQGQTAEDILVVHEPESLSVHATGMTADGKIQKSYTDLKRWLDKHQEKAGVIVMDIRQSTSRELAQLNDLLEHKVEDQQLNPAIQIVLVDTPHRPKYGPDFRRRVPFKARMAEPATATTLGPKPPAFPSSKAIIEIDLFNSLYWPMILLGGWQMEKKPGEETYSFQWKKGKLQEAIESGAAVCFKNPPQRDPRFNAFVAELQSLRRLSWADQSMLVDPSIPFYQSEGYDWPLLAKDLSLHTLDSETPKAIPVLSDASLLSFIQDPRYIFSSIDDQIQAQDSYLTQAAKDKTPLELICSPTLSKPALAQLLAMAQEKKVSVRLFAPSFKHLPEQSALHEILRVKPLEEKVLEAPPWQHPQIDFQLSEDVSEAVDWARKANPSALSYDISCLEATELSRIPSVDENTKDLLLNQGRLSLKARLSDILQQLKEGKTIILYGKIPPHLYESLTALSLGFIEGERFSGKLLVIAPPKDQALLEALHGDSIWINRAHQRESFAAQEAETLKATLEENLRPLFIDDTLLSQGDEKAAQAVDETRLYNTEQGLSINPWVMIEGPTGIGKSYFLEHVLPTSEKLTPYTDLKAWLERKPEDKECPTFVFDEASFVSELSGEGENFLERFKSLKDKPPHFLWKGKDYPLTDRHKVIFAFNPASYGAGRSTTGFLTEQALPISFIRLPDFYLRTRIVTPLFTESLKVTDETQLAKLSYPILEVYRWILNSHPEKSLITPREIKAMVNMATQLIQEKGITDPDIQTRLVTEVAYNIGRQTLLDEANLLPAFEKAFKVDIRHLYTHPVPKHYLPHQHEAYVQLKHLLATRQMLLKSERTDKDLGLGGMTFEGAPGAGKSYLMEKAIEEYLADTHEKAYRISASTPYHLKQQWLIEAMNEGSLIIADEINASLWPHKELNNFLMGLDQKGKPVKKPGLLIATQNPPSLEGRDEEDPALRRRLLKKILVKPESAVEPVIQTRASQVESTLFAHPQEAKAHSQPERQKELKH